MPDRSADRHVRNPFSVRLPEAEEARLREYAEARHISIGEAVRLAVRELLGDEVPEDAAPEAGAPVAR